MAVAEVPEAPVEVDHIPLRFADPLIEHPQPGSRELRIALVVRDEGLSFEHFSQRRGNLGP